MISDSNDQTLHELEYTLLKPNCHSWWIFEKCKKDTLEDNWGDERCCDEGNWHAHTKRLLWGLPEVVGMVQQVYCSRRRLLQRELEFHVWTINKSAHTKKSLETYLIIRVHFKVWHYLYANEANIICYFVMFCLRLTVIGSVDLYLQPTHWPREVECSPIAWDTGVQSQVKSY